MYYLTFPLEKDIKNLSEQEILNALKLQKTRFYTFNNFYMQGIQAGIQAKHSADELVTKFIFNKQHNRTNMNTTQLLKTVYEKDKTAILLNGGGHGDLVRLTEFFDGLDNNIYPYASFREEEEALNNAMTSVTAVFPELIFSNDCLKGMVNSFLRENRLEDTTFENFVKITDSLKWKVTLDDDDVLKFTDYFSDTTFSKITNILNQDNNNFNTDNIYFFIRKDKEKETKDIFFFNETDFLIAKKLLNYRLMT